MADERRSPPYNQPSAVPAKYNWPTLLKKDGDNPFDHYRHISKAWLITAYVADCKHHCLYQGLSFQTTLAVIIQNA